MKQQEPTPSPPPFLSDLLTDVLGERVALFPTGHNACSLRLVIGAHDAADTTGFFFDPDTSYGIYNAGLAWTIYSGGRPRFGHAWDDNEPDDFGEPVPFETWVRQQVLGQIAAHGRIGTDELWGWLTDLGRGDDADRCRARAVALIALADRLGRSEDGWATDARIAAAVLSLKSPDGGERVAERVLHDCIESMGGHVTDADSPWARLLPFFDGRLSIRTPDAVHRRLERELLDELAAQQQRPNKKRFDAHCHAVAAGPAQLHARFARSLITVAEDADLLHIAAAHLRSTPKLMAQLLEAALVLRPDDPTLLPALQGAYLHLGRDADASAIERKLGPPPLDDEESVVDGDGGDDGVDAAQVQKWIDDYGRLCNRFSAGSPPRTANVQQEADRLVALEARLNAYWRASFPDDLDRLVDQGRFLSAGSAGYVGWLRNEGRYQEAVDHVCEQLDDEALSVLRHRAHPGAFETFLNNGLGSFVDSHDPAHIPIGVELVERLRKRVELDALGDLQWQLACLFVRAGEHDRALGHVERAVAAGESIESMAGDPDLAPIVKDKRFRKLRK